MSMILTKESNFRVKSKSKSPIVRWAEARVVAASARNNPLSAAKEPYMLLRKVGCTQLGVSCGSYAGQDPSPKDRTTYAQMFAPFRLAPPVDGVWRSFL